MKQLQNLKHKGCNTNFYQEKLLVVRKGDDLQGQNKPVACASNQVHKAATNFPCQINSNNQQHCLMIF